ncbi:MAG: Sporulation domain protein [Gammaproteobacteria bacterium]|nr:Sporulation domain protein [Gammaproteobacteria bacterium]
MTQAWAKWEKQVINGVFPLHRCVSFSDHSAVYLTEHEAHELPFALLKLVPAIPTLKETQLAHWTAAATLAHPHLVRLLETGCCQLGSLQFLFVVMEYAEATLAETLTQRALTPDALRKGLRPILASLAFLHRRHLVHGGLKPSNILVVNQQVKLASDAVRPAGESAAGIAGSSVYDPPESRDGSFSTAGDVWSLGVFMVEALTQCRPSWPHKHAATPDLPATLSPLFEEIVRQCLNRNPDHRPTVAELAAAINPAAPQAPTESVSYPVLFPPEPPGPIPARLTGEEPDPAATVQLLPKRRSFVPAATAILIVSIVVWTGLRLLGSQAYSRATALPVASSQSPATAMSATSEISAAAPDPGFAKPETVVAPPSVLHEEAPDVPPGALETIRGHIKFAVRVSVDRSGNVVHATLANHSPSRYFTRLAIETARKWKFAAADAQDSRQWLLRFEFTRDGATTHATNPAQSNRRSSSLPSSLRPLPVRRTARVAFWRATQPFAQRAQSNSAPTDPAR